MNVKEVFSKAENGTLTYEEFTKLAGEAKFVDLNDGEYVSKNKYQSELEAKTKEIETLNGTITSRDGDLAQLKKQLEEAGTDSEKLTEVNNNFAALKEKYETDTKNYKKMLESQAYEFSVKEFANSLKFTSSAAKRDFIRELNDAKLKMDKDHIIGAADFKESYQTSNPDAFVVEEAPKAPEPAPQPAEPKPIFSGATPGVPSTKPTSLSEMMKMANEQPGLAQSY